MRMVTQYCSYQQYQGCDHEGYAPSASGHHINHSGGSLINANALRGSGRDNGHTAGTRLTLGTRGCTGADDQTNPHRPHVT